MGKDQQYTYSQLSAESVGRLVASHYALGQPLRSKFYVLGLHDNYLVESGGERFILRLYRNDWRSEEQVLFELELLTHLRDRNAKVAGPVRTIGGELCFRVESPEGERVAALFYYAEGYAPENAISVDECEMLGRTVADVHRLAETFATPYSRPVLDVPYLLDESVKKITPFIEGNERAYLGGLKEKLRCALPKIPKVPGMFGICMGDVNSKNVHITRDGKMTLFDFDQCGYGYRAFEIGKFASSLSSNKMKSALLNAFLHGYEEIRKLSSVERESIRYFELVALIWVMAIHAQNVDRIGYKLLEKPFWDRRLDILKVLADQYDAALACSRCQ